MKSESYIVIGNRYLNGIRTEIGLLPGRIEKSGKKMNFGFTFHNLASPCEMLVKYWGNRLREINHGAQVDRVQAIAKEAREIQEKLEKLHNSDDLPMIHIGDIENFSNRLQKLMPILFLV